METIFRVLEDPAAASVVVAALGLLSAGFWPLLVLILVIAFKRPLTSLIDRVQSLDAGLFKIRTNLLEAQAGATESSRQLLEAGSHGEYELRTGAGPSPSGPKEPFGVEASSPEDGGEAKYVPPAQAADKAVSGDKLGRLIGIRNAVNAIPVINVYRSAEEIELGVVAFRTGVIQAHQESLRMIRQLAEQCVAAWGHKLTTPYHDIRSEAYALQALKDSGVISPQWLNAWSTLRSTLADLSRGRFGAGENEAASWARTAHELVAQAQASMLLDLDREIDMARRSQTALRPQGT